MKDNNIDKYKHVLPEYFTLTEIADVLGYASTNNLRTYCKEGRLQGVKVEKLWLVPNTQAIEFIEETLKNRIN